VAIVGNVSVNSPAEPPNRRQIEQQYNRPKQRQHPCERTIRIKPAINSTIRSDDVHVAHAIINIELRKILMDARPIVHNIVLHCFSEPIEPAKRSRGALAEAAAAVEKNVPRLHCHHLMLGSM